MFDSIKLNAIAKAKKLFVSETRLRVCAIDSWISFLALAIASKKIQNCKWNSLKVVAIWRSQWNWGFSRYRVIEPTTWSRELRKMCSTFKMNHLHGIETLNISHLGFILDLEIAKFTGHKVYLK